jgi:hypothetical protein
LVLAGFETDLMAFEESGKGEGVGAVGGVVYGAALLAFVTIHGAGLRIWNNLIDDLRATLPKKAKMRFNSETNWRQDCHFFELVPIAPVDDGLRPNSGDVSEFSRVVVRKKNKKKIRNLALNAGIESGFKGIASAEEFANDPVDMAGGQIAD